jgi:hypothetical protein
MTDPFPSSFGIDISVIRKKKEKKEKKEKKKKESRNSIRTRYLTHL